MDFDDIAKIVDQVKVLEARLAVAEAEREKYQGLADNRLNCMALYRDLIGKHEARIGVLADKLNLAEAERDAALVEVKRLQADAERARWCEEHYANVFWQVSGQYWFCEVPRSPKAFTQYFREATRNAAIDAARGVR